MIRFLHITTTITTSMDVKKFQINQTFVKLKHFCLPVLDLFMKWIHSIHIIYDWPCDWLCVENWVPLKPVLRAVRDVARIHYPSCTDSINMKNKINKPSLQFFCNFLWLMLPRDHFVSRFLSSDMYWFRVMIKYSVKNVNIHKIQTCFSKKDKAD
jgi:hypothetical protein